MLPYRVGRQQLGKTDNPTDLGSRSMVRGAWPRDEGEGKALHKNISAKMAVYLV